MRPHLPAHVDGRNWTESLQEERQRSSTRPAEGQGNSSKQLRKPGSKTALANDKVTLQVLTQCESALRP